MAQEVQYFRIGVITSPHGIRGEVKVYPTTEDMHRFEDLEQVWVVQKGRTTEMKIDAVHYFKNMVILKLEGVADRNQAELLRQADLMIPREMALPLADGEYYIADLLGLQVNADDGTVLGELTDVMQTKANDIYEVTMRDGKKLLIPVIPDCILEVNTEEGFITVHLMKGLLEL